KWIRELPYVVWSLRTQPSRALHGNTPFFMVYGSKAVLPADLKFGAPRLIFESIAEAEATRLEDIDVLEEERLNAVIQSARYQQTLRRYHDKAVRQRFFSMGDLVLRRILTGEGRHKLSPLRSEEHTSELQSRFDLVCRLLLEKKNKAKRSRRGEQRQAKQDADG